MRVAVVGLGNAGYTLHLPALAEIPSVSIVGGCDVDEGRRARAAERFRIAAFDDFGSMLRDTRPDVVVIGTPPDSHAQYCFRSFEAGAHVICEKPFVSSLEEADAVIAAAAASKRALALNHEFRHMPIFAAVRDAVSRDAPHGPLFAQVWQLMDLPPGVEAGWRGQMRQRTLYEAGVHLVDFVLGLFGEKPVAVQAWTSACGITGGGDAVALATLEFSGGRLAHLTQNRLSKGESAYFEVRADTPSASYRASFGGRARVSAGLLRATRPHLRIEYGVSGLAWKERGHSRTLLARNPKNPEMAATRGLFALTLDAFRAGSRPPVSGQDGRDVLEVIAACYHASATGRRVALSEAAGLASLRFGSASA